MGYTELSDWEKALETHLDNVHRHFSLLLESGEKKESHPTRSIDLWVPSGSAF